MPSTEDHLKETFAGESQANRKYLAFARQADKEGLANIAKLFRTIAEAETIHAHGHLDALDGVGSTTDNLQSAIDGETFEYSTMYPPMLEQAEAEGHKAKRMFRFAAKAEAVHAELYKQALEAAQSGKDVSESNIYLCPFCGHVELGQPPERCPICNAKAAQFIKVE